MTAAGEPRPTVIFEGPCYAITEDRRDRSRSLHINTDQGPVAVRFASFAALRCLAETLTAEVEDTDLADQWKVS